ncbi:4'-phosphopantetheinyl transferase [Yoonia sp.]|uniref:4'-phosphopantetheinyl transferase family protein n=1 Tax=Yoonia sp. TaxID=2212373 RepID=UPI00358EB77F
MDSIRAALRKMLGPNAGIGVTDPAVPSDLWPEETSAMSRAIPKRRTEFAAGRKAARIAMAELDLPPIAIPQGADRAPIWPKGISGSISHCAQCCIAVVAQTAHYPTIGIDVEAADPLDNDLIPVVCTPAEQVWLRDAPDFGLAAKMIFSAKEAVYKAQYPLTGKIIGFDAVSLIIDEDRFSVAANPTLPTLKGTILIQEGLILSVAHV